MAGQDSGGDPIAHSVMQLAMWLGLILTFYLMLEHYPRYEHLVLDFLRNRLNNDWYWVAELLSPWLIGLACLTACQLGIFTFINGVRIRLMIGG